VGEWTVVDIGLDKSFIKRSLTTDFMLSRKGVRKLLKTRSRFDHKGTFGHALLIAGSLGKMGAAVLSAKAALRAGVGLLTIHAPKCGYTVLQTGVPEAMMSSDVDDEVFTTTPNLESYNSLGVGPGLGRNDKTVKALKDVMSKFGKPMVIDADALNILSANREMLHLVAPGSILTPHPKEFERLAGAWSNDFMRLEKQKTLARELNSVVVLKGAYTSIVSPDGRVFFNGTGNPGMATGGTGDVLTGILTGLLAQYSAMDAAVLGVHLHGLAGDLGVVDLGQESLVAGDLIQYLPAAFRQLRH
jgi:ADP-dependent NAD(P)H-hydrate dehydratase / NAD(P)H-hydrate epimerase